MTAELVLFSPLDGWAAPLAEVPDPVFAQAMLGDGVAVDPTGSVLHAPCDGVIISVHAARHAVSLRAEGGVELLMHVGLDTVTLGGAGFEVHVAEGQAVRAGEATAISGIGGKASVQQVVEAIMNAEQTLQTAIAVRDKVVAAYQEISRMAI